MSYDDLDTDTARLYRLLADHPGAEFTADPLAAALDRPIADVRHGLALLVEARLVIGVARDRYRRGDLPHRHVQALWDQHDEPGARRPALRSMIEWYLRRTAAADLAINSRSPRFSPVYEHLDTDPFTSVRQAQDWFTVEQANILASQHHAAQEGWDGLVFQLAETVWNPLRAGYCADELVDTQQLGVNAARDCQHPLEAVLYARLGFGETNRGRHDAAITACTTGLDRARVFGDVWAQATALSTRARAYTAADQPRRALIDLGRALVLDEERGDRRGIALRHRRIGQAYAHPQIADYAQALWHLREAAARTDAFGDQAAHVRVMTYLAGVHVEAGQPDAALFSLARFDDALTSSGSPRYRSHAHTIRGRAHAQLGDAAKASQCYATALDVLTEAGHGAAFDRDAVTALRCALRDSAACPGADDSPANATIEGDAAS